MRTHYVVEIIKPGDLNILFVEKQIVLLQKKYAICSTRVLDQVRKEKLLIRVFHFIFQTWNSYENKIYGENKQECIILETIKRENSKLTKQVESQKRNQKVKIYL